MFAEQALAQWYARLEGFSGQRSIVQAAGDLLGDPQAALNGYLQQCATVARIPYTLVAAPVQYDGQPAEPRRAPEFNEQGDAILASLGLEWDEVVDLEVGGVVG